MENAFKQWMLATYETEEFQEIAQHGCSGGIGGMIYYTETWALYQEFSAALHDILGNYKEEFGEWPKYVTDELGDDVRFANAVVWFCAEMAAQEMTIQTAV
jgi:hypothetical protein